MPQLLSRRGALAALMTMAAARVAHAHGPQQVIIATATVKANAPGGPWEVMIPPGKSATMHMMTAGTIDYYCRFHPNMKARIIVLAK